MARKRVGHSSRGVRWAAVILTALGLLLIGIVAVRADRYAVATTAVMPTPTATRPPDYPPDKAALLTAEEQAVATARANAPTKPAHPEPPPVQPAPTLVAGIDNRVHYGPFSGAEFLVRNFWQGPVGSEWLAVYSGAMKDLNDGSPGPAALRIYRTTPNKFGSYDLHLVGTFSAPTTSGPLTITAVEGELLHLQTDGGERLSFDLRTRQYR